MAAVPGALPVSQQPEALSVAHIANPVAQRADESLDGGSWGVNQAGASGASLSSTTADASAPATAQSGVKLEPLTEPAPGTQENPSLSQPHISLISLPPSSRCLDERGSEGEAVALSLFFFVGLVFCIWFHVHGPPKVGCFLSPYPSWG
jgi:hypothetical protein